jgi:hypothetical protein
MVIGLKISPENHAESLPPGLCGGQYQITRQRYREMWLGSRVDQKSGGCGQSRCESIFSRFIFDAGDVLKL